MKTTCGIFVVDIEGKLLICHPTGHKNVYSIPKGLQDLGETELQTAIRETIEETSLDLTRLSDKLIPLPYSHYKKKNKKLAPFLCKYDKKINVNDLVCDSLVFQENKMAFPEIDEFRAVSLDDAEKLLHESQSHLVSLIKTMLK